MVEQVETKSAFINKKSGLFFEENTSPGVLKLYTSIFLIYFWFLKLYFVNQSWKFMYRYFGIFFNKKSDIQFFLYYG